METGRIRIGTFYISIAILLLVETAAGFLMSREWRYPFATLGGVRLTEIVLLMAVFQVRGGGLGAIGLGRGQILSGIRRGAIWSAGFGIVVLSGFGILTLLGINPLRLVHVRLPENAFEIAIYFVVGGMVGPVAEEIVFRGILYGFFRRWGIISALFLSTATFVLLHSAFGPTQVIGGILFALAYEAEGKLMAPIVIHISGNTVLFGLSLFF